MRVLLQEYPFRKARIDGDRRNVVGFNVVQGMLAMLDAESRDEISFADSLREAQEQGL